VIESDVYLLLLTDVVERGNLDTSSQSSQDDLDADDMFDKGLPAFLPKIHKQFS
jgi:hypothetical protein